MLKVVHDEAVSNGDAVSSGSSMLDEIVRDGARQMPAAALVAEVAAYIEAHRIFGVRARLEFVTQSASGHHGNVSNDDWQQTLARAMHDPHVIQECITIPRLYPT